MYTTIHLYFISDQSYWRTTLRTFRVSDNDDFGEDISQIYRRKSETIIGLLVVFMQVII